MNNAICAGLKIKKRGVKYAKRGRVRRIQTLTRTRQMKQTSIIDMTDVYEKIFIELTLALEWVSACM